MRFKKVIVQNNDPTLINKEHIIVGTGWGNFLVPFNEEFECPEVVLNILKDAKSRRWIIDEDASKDEKRAVYKKIVTPLYPVSELTEFYERKHRMFDSPLGFKQSIPVFKEKEEYEEKPKAKKPKAETIEATI